MYQKSDATRRRDERGASAVEYGLMVALLAAAIAAMVALLGADVIGLFVDVCGAGSPFTC